MSPQLLWALAGIVLTVLTMGGVTISSYNSLDAATGKLVASEAGNIATAAKLWSAYEGNGSSFVGISSAAVNKYIPDLPLNAGAMTSKTNPAISFGVAPGTPTTQVVITIAGIPAAMTPMVESALAGKACVVAGVSATSLSYTCNG